MSSSGCSCFGVPTKSPCYTQTMSLLNLTNGNVRMAGKGSWAYKKFGTQLWAAWSGAEHKAVTTLHHMKHPSDLASCLQKHPERMTEEEHNDKVIAYASGLCLSRCIYVGRSRQAQRTIQRATAKIFLGQKIHNSNSTYAQTNTPCLKDLHLAGYN